MTMGGIGLCKSILSGKEWMTIVEGTGGLFASFSRLREADESYGIVSVREWSRLQWVLSHVDSGCATLCHFVQQ